MKKNRYVLLLLFLLYANPCNAEFDNYQFKFGILDVTPAGKLIVKEETTKIPLITKEKGLRFGFIIKKLDNGHFNGQLIVHLPSPPKQLTGHANNINVEPSKIMKFPISQYKGYWSTTSWFDKGDPTGIWQYEIYLDGKLFKEVEFNVMP